jgi:hypothetical protein
MQSDYHDYIQLPGVNLHYSDDDLFLYFDNEKQKMDFIKKNNLTISTKRLEIDLKESEEKVIQKKETLNNFLKIFKS